MSNETLGVATVATPEEHAQATGNTMATKGRRTINGSSGAVAFSVAHMAAAQLHGWNAHAAATTEPFTLTRDAYEAALKCALEGKDAHTEACSRFVPKFEKQATEAKASEVEG